MPPRPSFSLTLFHLCAAVWIAAMAYLATADPEGYRLLLQEDRVVEWSTVWLFLAAGAVGLSRSIPSRRIFDALVAVFCLFVAGEEFSWGQRLLGASAPEYFLRHNFQQELNLHNLPQSVRPGSVLMMALAGYGVVLPLLARMDAFRALVRRFGATAPPLALLPWFAIAILLLAWYPFTLTGEWVELLSGSLFLASARPVSRTFWVLLVTAAVFGAVMTAMAGGLDRGRDEQRTACADIEVRSLADDLVAGGAGMAALRDPPRRVHKRLWSAVSEDYVDSGRLRGFMGAVCAEQEDAATQRRRRYGIDPWGSPYWLLVEAEPAGGPRVTVYSFGPNRRRDIGGGDDVSSSRRF